jgi:hypothetical protein
MSNARITTYCLAAAGVLFSNQAMAQGGPPGGINANIVNPAALAAANAQALRIGTPVAFTLRIPLGDPPVSKYDVPVGQRLVIEYISGICVASVSDTNANFTVVTNGITNTYYPGLPNLTGALFSNLVKIYADPGTTIISAPGPCQLTFSGQLVTP